MTFASEAVLPSFEGVKSFGDIQKRFITSAKSIILEHELRCGECVWCISELELYLYTGSDVWQDGTTHQTSDQLTYGRWYAHHYDNGNWVIPRRSGLDITVGSEREKTYGGILIRQLEGKGGSGTAFMRIVRETLKSQFSVTKWSSKERGLIELINGSSIFSEPLNLLKSTMPRKLPLWIGPRIGITGTHENAPLRVSIHENEGMAKI
jgi:hypothetical protein